MHPKDLPIYERSGRWLAQRKFGGTRTMVLVGRDGEPEFLNRHGGKQEKVKPSRGAVDAVRRLKLPRGKEHLLDGEMLQGDGNLLVLFDVLAFCDTYLFGKPDQQARLGILSDCCGSGDRCDLGIMVDDGLVVAEHWTEGFEERFRESLGVPRLEGLVLRKKTSCLDSFGQSEYETASQIRCRKPLDTHYNF